MNITRRGHRADHGDSSIKMQSPSVVWENTSGCVQFSQQAVRDFSTTSYHDYTVSITATDVTQIFACLSQNIENSDHQQLVLSLRPALADIMRLALAVVGVIKPAKESQ